MKMITLAVCILAMAATTAADPGAAADSAALQTPPAIPPTPAAVADLVYARPFTLNNGYKFYWSKNRVMVKTGMLLVLKVDPALVYPRQVAEPVLYVGDQTAERVNHGYDAGHVIAIVPGKVDLSKAPIWFGTPELPERVDAAIVKAERAKANQAGIKPFSAEKVKAALAQGGPPLNTSDKADLLRDLVAPLIDQYSPKESYLADGFRVPVTKAAPKADED